MRFLLIPVLFLSTVFARATAYTVTAPPRVMAVGDYVVPCGIVVKTGSTVANAGNTIWSAPPTCTLPTGSLGTPGTYTITVTAGTLLSGGDSATYTNGTITVTAPTTTEAGLVNAFIPNNGATAPPSGFFGTGPWSVKNVQSNPVCTVSFGVDGTDCVQHLIASERGAQTATVKCSGTTVTASAGTPFTGILTTDGPVNINGTYFTVASYTDATHMVLTTTPTAAQCSTTSVTLYLPRTIVAVTAGDVHVTKVSGPGFTNLTILNEQLQIGTVYVAKIASVTDDTHLILQTAFSLPNVTGNVPMYVATNVSNGGAGGQPLFLYFPPGGQYIISNLINSFGAYTTMWGAGMSSELYVPPNSPAFQTTNQCVICFNPVNSNDTFHIFLYNMWIHVGVGNPKAIPLQFAPSNDGAIRNVLISSDDSACPEGLNIGKSFTGPGMMRNIGIYGCAVGIISGIPDHEMTGEYFDIQGQTGNAIFNTNLRLQIRKARIVEPSTTLPIFNTAAKGNMVLMDSDIYANGASACIQNSTTSGFPASAFYAKNVAVHSSCTTTVNDYGTGMLVSSTGDIVEQWTGTAQSLFDSGSPAASLATPATVETPQASDPAVSTWGLLSNTDATTWTASLAACPSTTFFTPPGIVTTASGNPGVTVPDCVNHLQFFTAMTPTPGNTYHIILTVAGTSTTPLIVEGCPNAQCGLIHTGSRTVVFLDQNLYSYNSSPGAGNVFIDDAILGGTISGDSSVTFQASQNVWARAWNQEQPTQPKVICLGGTIWVMGIKTEHNGPDFDLSAGCQMNIYGFDALGDPTVQGAGGNLVNLTDASLFITGMMSTQCTITGTPPCNNAFYFWSNENRGASNASLAIPLAQTVGSSQSLIGPLYSYGAQNVSINTMGGSATVGGSAAVQ